MPEVRLRPYRAEDAQRFDAEAQVPGALDFFGWAPSDRASRKFARDGMLGADSGNLVVDVEGVGMVGDVGWVPVFHGPPPNCFALNVGIGLFAEHRGRGYGTVAQRLLAEHLFAYTRFERLEASTDVLNVAEQRALEKAGFTREGVLRHAQWRAGAFHDVVLFSRLRGD
ncbi:GNAT family N-acetyltransferase [Amnibacterium setariae]|uniref:N-acetyltransferase n=1 Tax=Amnibacterium setariae TaxID=2306585 RepID=A0A3A1U9K2_9MICO|nr:GNAT family protein [Amnibacterium setariae]RIX30929.1 N-acetyltransferase [Amnibacterium setariae]